MKLYSDTLTSDQLHAATPDGVYLDAQRIGSPRKRARGWTVRLDNPTGTRRRNSGQWGADGERAASWDEHGVWMDALYALDPNMVVGPYTSRDDFCAQTARYLPRGMSAPWLKEVTA